MFSNTRIAGQHRRQDFWNDFASKSLRRLDAARGMKGRIYLFHL
jgi:hypothetical protein